MENERSYPAPRTWAMVSQPCELSEDTLRSLLLTAHTRALGAPDDDMLQFLRMYVKLRTASL